MKRLFLCFLFLLQLSGTGCSFELQKIDGRISVAGSEPFTYVRLIDDVQHEYRLVGPKAETLRQGWQGRNVQLDGRIVKDAIGPGMPAEFEVKEIMGRD